MGAQITSTLLMIRPIQFRFNEQTAVNNYYQKVIDNISPEEVITAAQTEFDNFVQVLRANGIEVVVVEDTADPDTPDSIFPNNWVSFHADGSIGLYPMYAENRRLERRDDIFELLKKQFDFSWSQKIDFTYLEKDGQFLEGTGSMILDRENKIAYAAISLRTHQEAFSTFCQKFGYQGVTFVANQSVDGRRLPIYHTNVMMCVGDAFAVICLDSIDNNEERENVVANLERTGKDIIAISESQKEHFAGNMLQVKNERDESFLVMSSAAYQSLNQDQITIINKYCTIIHSPLDTIEALGGGSARCMMAEIFLPKKK